MKIHKPAPPQNIHSQEAMDIAQKNAVQRHAAPVQEKQDEEKENAESTLDAIGQNSQLAEAPNDNPGQLKQEAAQMAGMQTRPNTRGFVDNRPEAIQMRKWQEMSDNSARSIQMRKWQEMSDNSARSIEMRKLQEMSDNSARSIQMRKLQETADNSPQAAQIREMQQKANNYDQNQMKNFFYSEPVQKSDAPEEEEVQLKENTLVQKKETTKDTGGGSKMPEEVQDKMQGAKDPGNDGNTQVKFESDKTIVNKQVIHPDMKPYVKEEPLMVKYVRQKLQQADDIVYGNHRPSGDINYVDNGKTIEDPEYVPNDGKTNTYNVDFFPAIGVLGGKAPGSPGFTGGSGVDGRNTSAKPNSRGEAVGSAGNDLGRDKALDIVKDKRAREDSGAGGSSAPRYEGSSQGDDFVYFENNQVILTDSERR
jgi:hypothetical protein